MAQWLRLRSPNAGRGPGFNPWIVNQILHATTNKKGAVPGLALQSQGAWVLKGGGRRRASPG